MEAVVESVDRSLVEAYRYFGCELNVTLFDKMSATNGDAIECTDVNDDNTVPMQNGIPFTFSNEPTLEQM